MGVYFQSPEGQKGNSGLRSLMPTVAVRISNVVQRYNTATREEKTTPDPHIPAITRRLDSDQTDFLYQP